MSGADFLKQKYNLHQSDEVESAANRHKKRTGEAIPLSSADALIQNYLARFKEILDRTDGEKRERGIESIKQILHDKFVMKEEEIPESYWEGIRRIARERGQGADLEQTDWETLKHQTADGLISDQRASLDAWIDYLSSADAPYPDWLKYFAMRSILGMGEYDKEKKKFTKRSKGTVKPYPDINREALALVLDLLEKKQDNAYKQLLQTEREIKNDSKKAKRKHTHKKIDGEADSLHEKLKHITQQKYSFLGIDETVDDSKTVLESEDFTTLYAYAIDKCTPASQEQLADTEGRWVKYDQGSDHTTLVQSIQGHGTGWCTAGESTAQAQLKDGDFYVYYSNDAEGKPSVPRAAIRMTHGSIAEVRGIAEQQNLDSAIAPVVEKKLQEFPDGKAYGKKVADMKLLTEIERKTEVGESFTKDDLLFLYEIDDTIEGFGYQKDPRIADIRSQRNPEEDMLIVFDCTKQEIAHNPVEIDKNTKAYVGPVQKGLFASIPDSLEHIYTSFPEGRIRLESLEIGSMTAEQLERALEDADMKMSTYSKSMLHNKKQFIDPVNKRYKELKGETETLDLVRLRVGDLGFTSNPTTVQLFAKVKELGLELCPPETGPYKRFADTSQPLGDWYYIGMEPVTDSDGCPDVFFCRRLEGGAWLHDAWARPDGEWLPDVELVFRRSKSAT